MDKYRRIPVNTFQHIALNGGVMAYGFDPATGTLLENDLMGPTSGGVNFVSKRTFIDFGADIDNCPKNTKELKRDDDYDIKISGAFITSDAALACRLMGSANVTTTGGVQKIVPLNSLDVVNDFFDVWIIGDYGNKNTGSGAGFIAVKVKDALSTGGFQLQSEDKNKWKFAFEFTAHYSIDTQDTVPFELYLKAGTDAPGIALSPTRATVEVGDTVALTATTYPATSTVTWASLDTDIASVSDGVVTGVAAGYCVIKASITESTVTYTDICTVTVIPAAAS